MLEEVEDIQVVEPVTVDAILERQELEPASTEPGPSGLQTSTQQRETPRVAEPSKS